MDWRCKTQTKQNMLYMTRKIILSVRRGRRFSSFQQWQNAVRKTKRARRSEHMHRHIVQKSKNAAFIRWHESVQEMRTMRSKSRLIIMRLKHRCVVECLGMWTESVRRSKMQSKVVRRMTQRRLACAFESFRTCGRARSLPLKMPSFPSKIPLNMIATREIAPGNLLVAGVGGPNRKPLELTCEVLNL